VDSGGTDKRSGNVLMNRPTIDSIPGISAARPETVVPKTTSVSPQYRLNNRAQAPCTNVFSVTWQRLAHARTTTLVEGGIVKVNSP
jgi:hypothetical protein